MTKSMTPLLAVLVACGGEMDDAAPEPPSTEAGTPRSGFYAMTITTNEDTCDPPRPTGDMGTAIVFAYDGGLNLPLPFVERDGGGPPHQDVPLSGKRFPLADCPGSEIDVSAARVSGDSFEVDIGERWTDVGACTTVRGAPPSDCQAKRRCHFTLVQACPGTLGNSSCR